MNLLRMLKYLTYLLMKVEQLNIRFWPVIFRQKIDCAKQNPSIRFAGESGADDGGLHRESRQY